MAVKSFETFKADAVGDLVSISAVDGQLVQTLGYTFPHDGGGNLYKYEAASVATCDGGFILDGEGGDQSCRN